MSTHAKSDAQEPEAEKPLDTQYVELSPLDWRMHMRSPAWRPPTDVFEAEEAIIVRVEIAGMQDDHFSIELNGRLLTIRGLRQDIQERRAFHQMEIRFGEFSIELELPSQVEADLVSAIYNNGFLRITLPRSRPRQIQIKE